MAETRDVRRDKHPFATVSMAILALALIGGAATAYPRGFQTAVTKVQSLAHNPLGTGTDARRGNDQAGFAGAGGAAHQHAPAECQSAVEPVRDQLIPGARGLFRSIQVVEPNCEKNTQAPGLLNALHHLVANAQGQGVHENHADGTGHGPQTAAGHADDSSHPGGS